MFMVYITTTVGTLNAVDTKSYISRWKPKVSGKYVWNQNGEISRFVTATISLTNQGTFGILCEQDDNFSVFIMESKNNNHILKTVLWNTMDKKKCLKNIYIKFSKNI